ncbi:MAG: bifunctional glutamine synthetase adenylyltransferase/deadenyltransferase [Rhizobiales bacterium TMED249]|nr:MAG: bifunctional glutamine synthetase adenylyltransferase/deadenyltransferase [Rhizobiales bacterium TMED249]
MTRSFSDRKKINVKRGDNEANRVAHSHLEDCKSIWIAELSAEAQSAIIAFVNDHEDLFLQIFAGSSFLTRIIRTRPNLLIELAEDGPDVFCEKILTLIFDQDLSCDRDGLMRDLRLYRQSISLATAMADIAGLWSLEEVTGTLTDFADASVRISLDWLLKNKSAQYGLDIPPTGDQCQCVVLGMGKYGARELNYSSDIDIVVFYEPDGIVSLDSHKLAEFWIDLTRDLSTILQFTTDAGFVFRVDLRLRPDPGSTPVAVSIPAAETYYESFGQNWERAAFIKARQIAGDKRTGDKLLAILSPFIWRKNLDFAAIEDVHAMKRQIHAVRGHGQIAVAGHNIKLGRGGIREIEFFVQTQQLIAGGRDKSLRGSQTCPMLKQLAERGWIKTETVDELTTAYHFLRGIEHRLQMQQDEQTHTLPKTEEKLQIFSDFCGYETLDDFRSRLTEVLKTVQTHYAELFEQGEVLADEMGNLVFVGSENDPETLETLSQMGFARAAQMSDEIRGWHSGRFAAVRTPRARELLTRIKPRLLKSLSQTPDPDFAFARFNDFLTGLPSGIQIFSLFQSNPDLLNLITDIVGTAPRLSAQLSRRPVTLDSLLDPNFNQPLSDADEVLQELQSYMSGITHFEDMLDATRRWHRENIFRIGTQILSGKLTGHTAGEDITKVADASTRVIFDFVMKDLLGDVTLPDGSEMAVLGLGKLGSREMTVSSDLDLIIVCAAEDYAQEVTYTASSSMEVFFSRAARRFISAMTAPTSEGYLFDIDMRLRPTGNAGPLVTKFKNFEDYQFSNAWLWEHMALTRGRVLAGGKNLTNQIQALQKKVFQMTRDPDESRYNIADMKKRLEAHHIKKVDAKWDIKHAPGGLVDIEFIAQGLCLMHGEALAERICTSTQSNLELLGAEHILSPDDKTRLIEALSVYSGLLQIFRLCLDTPAVPPFSQSLNLLLCQSSALPDMAHLEQALSEHQKSVRDIFVRMFGQLSD